MVTQSANRLYGSFPYYDSLLLDSALFNLVLRMIALLLGIQYWLYDIRKVVLLLFFLINWMD